MTAQDVEYIDPPKRRKPALLPDGATVTNRDRRALPQLEDGIKILDPKRETFAERQERLEGNRVPYASMVAHKEIAAVYLASGSTYRQAAAAAGISVRQIKKYYSQAEFRTRIDELRKVKFSKIAGRLLKEMEKRTSPEMIGKIELLDLLRVWDRIFGSNAKGGGLSIGEVNVTTNNYDSILASLIAANSEDQSRGFPTLEPEDLALPGGDPFE